MSWNYYGFRPYVSVAERRRNAERETAKLAKKGKAIRPVRIDAAPSRTPSGQGLVRQPGVLYGLREPPAARSDLCAQWIGGPPGHPGWRDRGAG